MQGLEQSLLKRARNFYSDALGAGGPLHPMAPNESMVSPLRVCLLVREGVYYTSHRKNAPEMKRSR